MKKGIFIILSIIILSCNKGSDEPQSATPVPPIPAPKKGSLLFWINDPYMLSTCGAITIKLSNGRQSNITGYYYVAPANCINYFGGYFYVEEGTYTYTVLTGNSSCQISGGTATVTGETCNFARIQ